MACEALLYIPTIVCGGFALAFFVGFLFLNRRKTRRVFMINDNPKTYDGGLIRKSIRFPRIAGKLALPLAAFLSETSILGSAIINSNIK